MKHKYLSDRCMSFLTDMIITFLPILVWDVLILLVLAGFLPAGVMSFLDSTIKYILLASILITCPFIALAYGQTFGTVAFSMKLVDAKMKKAHILQVALRQFLAYSVIPIAAYYFLGIKGILGYFVLNILVLLIDPQGRIPVDFITHTKLVSILKEAEDITKNIPAKKVKKDKKKLQEAEKKASEKSNAFHIDLHTHSRYSLDGELTVEEVFVLAQQKGIEVLSITDHNSVKANFEAGVLSECLGIHYIPGVEVDCIYQGVHCQLLGYNIDFKDNRYIQLENNILKQERNASIQRIEKLKEVLGIDINVNRLIEKNNTGIVSGEMIAEELLTNPLYESCEALNPYRPLGERGDNPYVNFYWDYFAPGKSCYVGIIYPEASEVIELIKDTGGYAILAHPKKFFKNDPDKIKELLDRGVRGIEVFSPYHTQQDIKQYLEMVREQSCFVTCGSDFHGKAKPALQLGESQATNKFDKLLLVFVQKCLKQ